ncbi:uncharacterized protein ACA1_370940 [Acanthamoeba castellanii str. Neff]|uniref:Uncharacterized protein n=1 Tax=Acanthamoeba castellanii (strain ATCC 30010 / Neff) TaxID=1257118 RepID=L8GZ66_ACACF|nr:uncharacterized protein ACA1_370940 [Acanthamoeba castellanii str. Neff]ELR18290.1 hypothetical protein ACA1_370940 [Acanthamoeba castellanii str. Neff]
MAQQQNDATIITDAERAYGYTKHQYKFSASERSWWLAKIVPYAVVGASSARIPAPPYLSDVVPMDEFMGHATCNAILGDDDKTVAFITPCTM